MFDPIGYLRLGQAAKRLHQEYLSGNVNVHTHHLDFTTTNIDEEDARAELGKALASKRLRAAGIFPESGELVAIPDSYFRTNSCRTVVFEDQPTGFLAASGNVYSGLYPLIAEKDIQICFGCDGYFLTPSVWPLEWGKQSPFTATTEDRSPNAIDQPHVAAMESNDVGSDATAKLPEFSTEAILPHRQEMDAAEILSWIAFKKALPIQKWYGNIYRTSRQWPFYAGCFYSKKCLCDPISEIGGPWLLLKILTIEAEGKNWRDEVLGFLILNSDQVEPRFRGFLGESGVDAERLRNDLQTDINNAEPINESLRRANSDLRRALEAGRLRAAGGPTNAYGTLEHGRAYIAADEWKIGTEILPDGRMVERDGATKFEMLLFDTDEILRLWPANLPDETHPSDKMPLKMTEPTIVSSGAGGIVGAGDGRQPGGAPLRYNWDAFWIEVTIWIDGNGFNEGNRALLQRHMQSWTAEQWSSAPDPSTIREKLKALFHTAASQGVAAAPN